MQKGGSIVRQLSLLRTIVQYRELIFFFVYREFRIRYKQTLLGIGWAIVQPFSQMIIFTVVFFYFAKIKSEGIPYPVFVMSGLLPWMLFQGAMLRGVPIFINYSSLITKIYFPRVVLLIAATLGLFVDFLFSFLAFCALCLYFGVPIHSGFAVGFAVIAIQFILTIGILCFASTLTVYFRDVNYALALGLQLWMFATPVVYSLDSVPARFRIWYDLNPMVGLIHNYRQLVLHGSVDWILLAQSAAVAILVLVVGFHFLAKMETDIADVI